MLSAVFPSAGARLRAPGWRRARICVAVLCVLVAVMAAPGAARRQATSAQDLSAPVVVAARELPAGELLRPGDLLVAHWPRSVRPATALTGTGGLLGERLAGPVGAGEPVTRLRVVSSSLTAGLASGTVATPVLVGFGVARLVHAGDRIDLIAAAPADSSAPDTARAAAGGKATLVARGVRVLAVLDPRAAGPFGGSGTQLVLATGRHLALRITALQAARTFAVVVDPP